MLIFKKYVAMSFLVTLVLIPLLDFPAQAVETPVSVEATQRVVAQRPLKASVGRRFSAPTEAENQVSVSYSCIAIEERQKGEERNAQALKERLEREALIQALINEDDVVMLAQLIQVEAGGVFPLCRRAAVGWSALNRVDSERWIEDNVHDTLTRDGQFAWRDCKYDEINYRIARDVMYRWAEEQISGYTNPGRILPSNFDSFYGDGTQNHFYDVNGVFWDYEVEFDPYENWITEL